MIWPNLDVSVSADVIYAPTTYPAPEACIESTTAYEAQPWGLQIWAWDWCSLNPNGKVGKAVDVNAKFLRTYTRAANGTRAYLVRVEETDVAKNEWTDYLYNYATKSWNVFYVSSGNADIHERTGWDAYETYSKIDKKTGRSFMCGYVAAVGPIVSEGLRIRTPSGWTLADTDELVRRARRRLLLPARILGPGPELEIFRLVSITRTGRQSKTPAKFLPRGFSYLVHREGLEPPTN